MSDDPRKPAERSAATSAAAWTLFLVATVVGLAIDLWTKAWAFAALGPNPVVLDRAQVIELTRSGRSLSTLVPDHTPTTLVPHALDARSLVACLALGLGGTAALGLGLGRGRSAA